MFINHQNGQVFVASYRIPSGIGNGSDIVGFVEDIIDGRDSTCDLIDGIEGAITDGSLWANLPSDKAQLALELIDAAIRER